MYIFQRTIIPTVCAITIPFAVSSPAHGQTILSLAADLLALDAQVTAQGTVIGDIIDDNLVQASVLVNLDAGVNLNAGDISILQNNQVTIGADILTLQGDVTTIQTDVTNIQGDIVSLQGDVVTIQGDVGLLQGQVTAITTDVSTLQVNLAANDLRDDGQDTALATLDVGLAANNLRDDGQDTALATLDVGLAANNLRDDGQDTALATLDAGLAANNLRDDGQDTVLATLDAGLAANNLRDDGQDTALATLDAGLAANNLRDDGQDTALATLDVGLAANNLRDDGQDLRLDGHDAQFATNSVRIDAAQATGDLARLESQYLRDDIDNGRAGLVRANASGALSIAQSMGGSSISIAGMDGDRRLSGVADGTFSNDAASVGQVRAGDMATLSEAMAYTDSSLAGFNGQIDNLMARVVHNDRELRNKIDSAAAGAAALAGLPQSFIPGRGMVAVSVGGRGDQAALAVGFGKAFDAPNTPVVRAAAAYDSNSGSVTYNAAVGFHF